mmetsp:Transcript_1847/g.1269  ORF Transcript_1847/g.1269 Transcript_1847/m.1269 type:complete len:155 (+) Transcript_1847:813-1277(+)|eukprot:CAMPEP_0116879894 /NCGR_PEP_ID=MMETSP0463-20121206/11744_1 /TAXON_ID=181622 /ORGANISM="Strombidinopsis sp, Strain SopsisLIS2011" /LENGTH=154 /DNA_ID=CAMNT_0004529771 /DNA_START=731 /DNA_END=1195 /DNA_ORIENTATION=-
MELFYPITPKDSKFSPTFTSQNLDDVYQNFIDKFESVVLIGFGTSLFPEQELVMKLLDVMQHESMKDYGFIFSFKNNYRTETYYDSVVADIPSNLLIQPFVPQKKLLQNEKVKLFVTHCGAGSVSESLNFGTPMLGFPQAIDQFIMCQKVELYK